MSGLPINRNHASVLKAPIRHTALIIAVRRPSERTVREQRMNLGQDGSKALAWSMNIEPAINNLRLASFAVGLPRCKAEDPATRDD